MVFDKCQKTTDPLFLLNGIKRTQGKSILGGKGGEE